VGAALSPNERDRTSYLPENFVPLQEAGLVDLVDGDREVTPGVDVVLSPGTPAATSPSWSGPAAKPLLPG